MPTFWLNDHPFTVPDEATLAQALAHVEANPGELPQGTLRPPFAVAVNRVFVPRAAYRDHRLQQHDRIDVVRPVTGG